MAYVIDIEIAARFTDAFAAGNTEQVSTTKTPSSPVRTDDCQEA